MSKKIIFSALCSFLFSFSFLKGTVPSPTETKLSSTLIPREVLFGNPEKHSPMLSPDGTQLAYLAPDQVGVLNVWLKDLSGEKEDQLITSDKKRGIHTFLWQYDGQHILYVQDRGGDENWHLYQTNIQTKLTRDLTPFEGAKTGILAYQPEFPNEILVQLNIRDPGLFDVYRINLKNGAVELETENTHDAIQWLADNKLNVRASSAFNENGQTVVRVRNNYSTPWRELIRWDPEDQGGLVTFSADDRSLYIVSSKDANSAKLIKINLADDTREMVVEDPRYDLDGEIMTNPISHEIEAVGVTREHFEWIAIDPKVEKDFAFLAKKDEEMKVVSRDLNDRHWIVMYTTDKHPSHFYYYDRVKKENTFLFSTKPKLEGYALSTMQSISFKARDGMLLYGYLSLPQGKEAKNLPTVLLVHGGPWARNTWGCNPEAQWLTNRGYAVLQINFRGSTGYGKEYLNAGNKEWAGKMHTDLLDGKQWMISQGYTDPEKVAIYGGSYGGYATLVALTFTPEEFCCGVDLVGPSNLVTLLQTIPPYWAPMMAIFNTRLGNLDTEKEFLESRSPFFKANQITRPLLIAQGANDPRVKQSESDQIVEALRNNGKEVEYMLVPDEGHGFARPENMLKFCALAEDFLHKHMGGEMEPAN